MTQLELLNDLLELLSDVVGRFEVPVVEVVLEAPVHILVLALVFEEGVHESEVVAVLRDELRMGVGGFGHLVFRAEENVG